MKTVSATIAAAGALIVYAGGLQGPRAALDTGDATASHSIDVTEVSSNAVIGQYCVRCHNDRRLRGNLSLEGFDARRRRSAAEIAEKMIVKLRAGMMPPPGRRPPGGRHARALWSRLSRQRIDAAAAAQPQSGRPDLPAPEPGRVRALRSTTCSASRSTRADFLPLDTKSANFDNIADVQMLSPTLLDAYLNAAAEISRLAVGDPRPRPRSSARTRTPGYASQAERVEGAPFGTRGGVSVIHNFPADGDYVFQLVVRAHDRPAGYYRRNRRRVPSRSRSRSTVSASRCSTSTAG